MARNETREDLKQYAYRELGYPVVQIEIADVQAEDRIDDALDKFYENHYDAVDPFHILISIFDSDVEQGYIQFPEEFHEVTKVMVPRSAAGGSNFDKGIFNPEYQYHLSELYEGGVHRTGNLHYYWMNQRHLSLVNSFFSPEKTFHFNKLHRRLTVQGLYQIQQDYGGMVVSGYKKVGVSGNSDDSNFVPANIWNDVWLKKYVTELFRRQWGQNLSKYEGVQMIGGVTMNGASIYQEAKDNITKLEEELQSKYSLPIDFMIG